MTASAPPRPDLPRAAGLQLLRMVTVFNSVGIVVAIALLVVAFNQIQTSRREAIRISCEQRNVRNFETKAELDRLIDELPPGPRKRRAVDGRAGTELLIDRLAPRRDCDRQAQLLVP